MNYYESIFLIHQDKRFRVPEKDISIYRYIHELFMNPHIFIFIHGTWNCAPQTNAITENAIKLVVVIAMEPQHTERIVNVKMADWSEQKIILWYGVWSMDCEKKH